MRKIILGLAMLGLYLFNIQLAAAAEDPSQSAWQDIEASISAIANVQNKQKVTPDSPKSSLKKFRSLSLNESLFKNQLTKSGTSQFISKKVDAVDSISIPLPDGKFIRVALEKTHVLPPQLAAKYPKINTWKVTGIDDTAVRGRVDFTNYGFHAMLSMADGDTVFVERNQLNSEGVYKSFSRRDNTESFNRTFECDLHGEHASSSMDELVLLNRTASRQASSLITYRLAVAATGEYTQFHGSVSNALSAIVTTINRVNEINERDLAITFQLVPEEASLIYTNPLSDPYTNNDASVLGTENIFNLDDTDVLGASRFDIGHVFSQGLFSGNALLGSACQELLKAGGVTGSPTPQGDAFDIDFVAHELGHQLGGTHTFNSETLSCSGDNRHAVAAVEPGSGSTIMAYAGICGVNNLQNNSDPAYHFVSINQIFNYTRNNEGSLCGTRTAVTNEDPEPDAGPDFTIPANTPFILVGSGTDPDLDSLTYSWEQIDAGTASDVDIDVGDNAIIRSFLPSSNNLRYIPNLKDLFANTRMKGEILPETNRELNFSLTLRDNKGGLGSDRMKLDVIDTGRAFTVTSHNISQSLNANQMTTIRWDVAGTNFPPLSCNSVDISLLAVNGENNFVTQTANDGQETVTIPADISSMNAARIMLKCSDKPFFNVSTADLRIQSGVDEIPPVITLLGDNPVKVFKGAEYTDPGVIAEDSFDTNVIIVTTGSVDTSRLGSYTITYNATDDSGNSSSISRIINVVEVPVFDQGEGSSSGGGGSTGFFLLTFLILGLLRQFRGDLE